MKLSYIFMAAVAFLNFACATPQYSGYRNADQFKKVSNNAKGKSPREVAATMGKPMSAYYSKDGATYYMVWPQSETPVSVFELMSNDRLECLTMNFEKEKGFKYDGWSSNTSHTCGSIKGETLDTSLID